MIKKSATIGVSIALFAASAVPVFAAVPPGPPVPAELGCPGRSVVDPGLGPQASQPDLEKMADGECPVPAGFVPTE